MIDIEEKKFRSWLDKYFDLFPPKNPIVVSLGSAFAIYLLGFIISIIGKFVWLYIKTYMTLFVLFGITWVASWMRWGHYEFFRIIKDFPFSSKHYRTSVLIRKLKLATDNRLLLVISILLTFSLYFCIIGCWLGNIRLFGQNFYFPAFISTDWFSGPALIPKILTLIILITPTSFLIGTSGTQMIIYNFNVLPFLGKHFDSGILFVLPQQLKSITRLNLKITYTWFVGVTLVAVTLYKTLTVVAWSYLAIFILVGLIQFFFPQIIFHQVLEDKKTKLLRELGTKCKELFPKVIQTSDISNITNIQHLCYLSTIYKTIEASSTWILNFSVLAKLITSSLTPIVAMFIKVFIAGV